MTTIAIVTRSGARRAGFHRLPPNHLPSKSDSISTALNEAKVVLRRLLRMLRHVRIRCDELPRDTDSRFDMCMFPLRGEERAASGVLIRAVTVQQRTTAAQIGMQFRRELSFDSAPFDPDDRNSEAVLILSRKFLATFPIAAGAAGLEQESGQWVLKWVWLHPYERGTILFDEAWDELEQRYGQFFVEGPYSPAMGAFLRRRGVSDARFDLRQLE